MRLASYDPHSVPTFAEALALYREIWNAPVHSDKLPMHRISYDYTVDMLNRIEGWEIFRAMELDRSIDATTHEPLGIYWALFPRSAQTYWAEGGDTREVFYTAELNLAAVDIPATIAVRMSLGHGTFATDPEAAEEEIRLIAGHRIFVLSVATEGVRGETLINDWRRA